MRLRPFENLGKREAILEGSRLIRRLADQTGQPLRVLELGCGEGQVVGTLVNAHASLCSNQVVVGVDYNPRSLARCRADFPGWLFVEGDFTDSAVLNTLREYDIVMLVNALHEVFSAGYSAELGEVDAAAAKLRVERVLEELVGCLRPGGWLLLFDGLEPPGDPLQPIRIRFLEEQARIHFDTFVSQYRPFHIHYREVDSPLVVELSRHDFARYITKSIFLGKQLWQNEQAESYQYFTQAEFEAVFARLGLQISALHTLVVNDEKWRRWVQILTPQEDFPQEHILILARRA